MDSKLKDLIRRRMALPGNYVICSEARLDEALGLTRPGDTVSIHDGDGPPMLYEVGSLGELRPLDPEVD